MVRSLLTMPHDNSTLDTDAADALAIALCHSHRQSTGEISAPHRDWAAFLRANPERLKQ